MNIELLLTDPKIQQQVLAGAAVLMSALFVLGVLMVPYYLSRAVREIRACKKEIVALGNVIGSFESIDLTQIVEPKVHETTWAQEKAAMDLPPLDVAEVRATAEATGKRLTTENEAFEELRRELDSVFGPAEATAEPAKKKAAKRAKKEETAEQLPVSAAKETSTKASKKSRAKKPALTIAPKAEQLKAAGEER